MSINITKRFFQRVIAASNTKSSKNLQNEIQMTTENLRIIKADIEKLVKQLTDYHEKEQLMSQVVIQAQLNACQIELEARQKARLMIEKCSHDLTERKKALNKLRSTVSRLRKQYRRTFRPGPPVSAPPDKSGGPSGEPA